MSPASTQLRPRPMPADDADRITPPMAAGLVQLGYPEAFNAARWTLEEAFDPATGATMPWPADLRIPYRTTSQLAKLAAAEREAYLAARARRIAWTREHWMRVPAWGGRAAPGGEYRYSAARCAAWHRLSLGGGTDAE